jgi:hypothetical protein
MTIVDENKCITNGNSCCVGDNETPRCSDFYTPIVTRNACRWDSPISGKWNAYRCVKEYDPSAPLQPITVQQYNSTAPLQPKVEVEGATWTPPPGSVAADEGWVLANNLENPEDMIFEDFIGAQHANVTTAN